MSKLITRRLVTALLKCIGSFLTPAGSRARLSILIYHRVLPKLDPLRKGLVSVETFRNQMAAMAEHFNVLPLNEAIERLQSVSLPPRAACVTFDDGYADNFEFAVPILRELGLPATFFVTTRFLNGECMWNDLVIEYVRHAPGEILDLCFNGMGYFSIANMQERRQTAKKLISKLKYLHPNERSIKIEKMLEVLPIEVPEGLMMNYDQVRSLNVLGMQVGAHTVNHPILTSISQKTALDEILGSKEELEGIVGRPVDIFAYPNGKPVQDYSSEHVVMVRKLGFKGAVTTAPGAANGSTDYFQLPRFTPWKTIPSHFVLQLFKNIKLS